MFRVILLSEKKRLVLVVVICLFVVVCFCLFVVFVVVVNKHTMELINARSMSHKLNNNNKDLSRLR